MFPIFLFLVVFSFYCCLAYELQQISDQQQRLEIVATKITPPVQPTVTSPVQLGDEVKVPEIPIKEATREPFVVFAPSDKLVLNDINSLKIRSARKVASALGIRQKANGVDKSLGSLQQEIKQYLHSDYGQVVLALELAKVG